MYTLIIINTYSQLIIAIHMKRTILKSERVSILITDFAKDSYLYSKNIQKQGIFEKVYYIEAKKYCPEPQSFIEKWRSIKWIIFGNRVFNQIEEKHWDKLLFYNTDTSTYCIYVKLAKQNPNIICCMYEEGIMSYSVPFSYNKRYEIVDIILKQIGIQGLEKNTKDFLCFYPTYYTGKLKARIIPRISTSDQELINIITATFEVDPIKNNHIYNKRYIYFSGVYDFEGGKPIGELNLVEKISEIVGKENLIVKVHPRDNEERFKRRGLNVAESSNIPWEAIQMTSSLKNVTFLTALSGSVLLTNMIVTEPIKSVFLFSECDLTNNKAALRNANDIKSIIDNGIDGKHLSWLSAPKTELEKLL